MQELRVTRSGLSSSSILLGGFVFASLLAAALIGVFPLEASIITIFLFAGLHNAMEFRYFIARMPRRWGRSRIYYSVGIGGVIVLASAYIALYFTAGNWMWSSATNFVFSASWNTALVLWAATLFYLRGKQRPKSDWSWAFPVAFLLAALAWSLPNYWSLALVYLHPFVAMYFLERQIRRTRPEWLTAYHWCLVSIIPVVAILWSVLASQPALPQDTPLFWRINQHAGSEIITALSSRLLVATHVYLESIHYFVWILLMPLVDKKAIPWRLSEIPLFSGKDGFPKMVTIALAASVILVIICWAGFGSDYSTTRDLYFAFAIGHVLAEFPFLIKML